ncbi:hypothetical protein ACQ4N7_13510 [Nodosilinea sp. AN01ver1]|uniref:hypothetical protein n=1 Tax=Nodosilinea sp. AN01ver1 TaxID=3423362 RepID=UPI003D313FB4
MEKQLNLDLVWGGYYASISSDDGQVSVFRMLDFNRDAYHAALFAEKLTDTPTLEQLRDLFPSIGHVPIDARSLLLNDDLQMIARKELSHSDLEGYIYYLEAHEVPQEEINDLVERILGFSRNELPLHLCLEIIEDQLVISERE